MLGVFTLGLSPTGRGPVRSTHCRSRSSVLRMAGASDRMAQDGVLYDGWGAEGLKSLNATNSLLDHSESVGVNRYDLTRIVAQQAKDIAYAHCTEDDMLNPMLAGNQARLTLTLTIHAPNPNLNPNPNPNTNPNPNPNPNMLLTPACSSPSPSP